MSLPAKLMDLFEDQSISNWISNNRVVNLIARRTLLSNPRSAIARSMDSMAWRVIGFAVVLTLFHSATASAARQLLQTCGPAFTQYICAPSYVYPCGIGNSACAWYSFSNGADIVIINPNSGPGTAVISDYSNLVSTIRAAGSATYITTILGYVATTYGNKNLTNVRDEIDKYNSFYSVDGIFFDEAYSADCTKTSYYASAVEYVQDNTASPDGQAFTIFNWGTNGPECYLTSSPSADNFVTFESPYSSYTSYAPLAYMANYSPDRWYHIVYGVSQANLISTLSKSKLDRAGLVYVTNDDGANPYDTAPSPFTTYWQAEVDKVAQPC